MDIENLRITKLKDYLVDVVKEIGTLKSLNINALDKNVGSYSLDKIPTNYEVERWVTGIEKHRDTFLFRGRFNHSYNEKINIENIGFYEIFERKIFDNNKKGILPDIENIEQISCLNPGTLNNVEVNTAEFNIQIEIQYLTE